MACLDPDSPYFQGLRSSPFLYSPGLPLPSRRGLSKRRAKPFYFLGNISHATERLEIPVFKVMFRIVPPVR